MLQAIPHEPSGVSKRLYAICFIASPLSEPVCGDVRRAGTRGPGSPDVLDGLRVERARLASRYFLRFNSMTIEPCTLPSWQ